MYIPGVSFVYFSALIAPPALLFFRGHHILVPINDVNLIGAISVWVGMKNEFIISLQFQQPQRQLTVAVSQVICCHNKERPLLLAGLFSFVFCNSGYVGASNASASVEISRTKINLKWESVLTLANYAN